MVVSPRYAEYEDTLDTGTCVPVLLPPATSPHNMSADSFPPGDSSSSLTGSQGGADAPSMPSKDSAAHVSEVQPFRQDVSTAPGSSNPELDSAEHKQQQQQQQQQEARFSAVLPVQALGRGSCVCGPPAVLPDLGHLWQQQRKHLPGGWGLS